ncbi:MAG: hypothetical protein ABEN55_19425 [Bradymonadaceae bacterium]
MSDRLRLVHGPDALETLKEEGEMVVFGYKLNKPVFVLTLVIGAAILGLAGMMWWNSGLATTGWIAGFAVLITLGGGIGALAAHWYAYTQSHFLAISEDKVFVGQGDRMWSIDWELLDRDSLGFEQMSVSSTGGSLDLDVADEEIEVRLYNTFVRLEDIQGFMFRILQHLKDEADAELEEPADDDS